MEDIGGILFYIIAAVVGIVTTVANKKKKAAKPSVSSDTIEREVFDESFEEVDDIVYQPIPEEKFGSDIFSELPDNEWHTDAYSFDQPREGEYEEPMAEEFSSEGISAVSDTSEENELTEEKDLNIENAGKDGILKDFDMKKAVIFSEILNRKYS